ncbi:MAG TPA: helix-turn-helix transcriptional regulator, partial [Thermoanaerobaculia bacterium]|nr:helix-turn-helix transcriptional regulator [Thermoanaerobaculia bacterium]
MLNKPECVVFGHALARLREAAGLRQYAVAEKAKVTKAMVSSYETGKVYPTIPTLLALLRATGSDFSDLQRSIDVGLEREPSIFLRNREDAERLVGKAVISLFDKLRHL